MADLSKYDEQILAAVKSWPRAATYVVRNILNNFGKGPNLGTAQVLRRLKVMEKRGLVERVNTSYAVMICWRAKAAA